MREKFYRVTFNHLIQKLNIYSIPVQEVKKTTFFIVSMSPKFDHTGLVHR